MSKWTREPGTWIDEGLAAPDYQPNEPETEFVAHYTGPNGGTVQVSYWIREWPAEQTNLPFGTKRYEPGDFPKNAEGEPVLYSVEECGEYVPAGDEGGDRADYWTGEGSGLWFWTLDAARKEAKRLADGDESDTLGPDAGGAA
jgi:hypothetical protein